MPIFYNKVNRISNPSEKNSPRKYYPVAKSIRRMKSKEVAQYIARETTLNPMEAEMAIAQLREAVLFFLKQGYTVSLGDWATFRVTLNSLGADSEADCTPARIKNVKPHCTFGKEFLSELQRAEFQLGSSMDSERSNATPEGGQGGSGTGDPGDVTP
ncbi:MAG: DNA-binding protein [Bacteroidaceae bacterium]|nr:DNA-binding protein [Bacteroidaceae bacterium]